MILSFKEQKNFRGIFNSIIETIGKTPIVKLSKIKKHFKLRNEILAKLEFFNPLSSVKDRIGLAMINEAEKKNLIKKNTIIIEPTSGNTGISLAFICASRGYKLLLTMPESMSIERRKMLLFLGAEIILTSSKKGMEGAIQKAKELKSNYKDSIILQQFSNPSNPDVIGSGGKIIRDICDKSSAKVEIDDDGNITISCENKKSGDIALDMINDIVAEPEIGKIYEGKVVKTMDFGAFVNFMGTRDGLVHISQLKPERVEKTTDVVNEGDMVKVKVLAVDDRGKVKLSIKDAVEN